MQEAELRGSPSLAMWLVNGFQLLYVGDALWHEVRLDWAAGAGEGKGAGGPRGSKCVSGSCPCRRRSSPPWTSSTMGLASCWPSGTSPGSLSPTACRRSSCCTTHSPWGCPGPRSSASSTVSQERAAPSLPLSLIHYLFSTHQAGAKPRERLYSQALGPEASGRVWAVGRWPGADRRSLTACSLFPPAVGYYIFRGANSQKNTFRKNPSDPRVAGELGF